MGHRHQMARHLSPHQGVPIQRPHQSEQLQRLIPLHRSPGRKPSRPCLSSQLTAAIQQHLDQAMQVQHLSGWLAGTLPACCDACMRDADVTCIKHDSASSQGMSDVHEWVSIAQIYQALCMTAAWHARMKGGASAGTSAAPPGHPTARRKDHRRLLQQLQEAQAQADAVLASSRAELQVAPMPP